MSPLSNAALLFNCRRSARSLAERGVDLKQPTRHVTVDGQTSLLLADLLELPADFVNEVFGGVPVSQAEGIASWAMREQGFRRVNILASYALKRGRIVSVEAKVAAYEATREVVA